MHRYIIGTREVSEAGAPPPTIVLALMIIYMICLTYYPSYNQETLTYEHHQCKMGVISVKVSMVKKFHVHCDLTNLQMLPMPMLIDGEAEIICTEVPDSPTFMIGDKVTLTCTVRNVSDRISNELTYQWFRKGLDTDTEDMLEKTGKVIILPLLTLKDKGSYQCVVTCDKFGEWTIKSNLLIVEVIGELSAYDTARLA